MMRHLYIHIPFCHRRCSYCDFNTYANMENRIQAYVDALCVELRRRAQGLEVSVQPNQSVGDEFIRVHKQAQDLPSLAMPLLRHDLLPTIFFGGGTPSMLSLPQLEQILTAADGIVPRQGAEVTIEANPGTVLGRDYLRGLRDLGVNRISMGVQSLDDPMLRVLGRIHTANEARQSFEDARAAGFTRINLDFIFGLPGQTTAAWEATLREIVTWGADHFSLYSLILEESTPLYAQVTAGRISVPNDDITGEMYEQAMVQFAMAGYQQYEISNWARSQGSGVRGQGPDNQEPRTKNHALAHNVRHGTDENRRTAEPQNQEPRTGAGEESLAPEFIRVQQEHSTFNIQHSTLNIQATQHSELKTQNSLPAQACHHNLAYWLNADYAAVGAGAHGHQFPARYHNILRIDEYIAAVQRGELPTAETVPLAQADLYSETMFMGLRLNSGVSDAHFLDRCGTTMDAVFGAELAALLQEGLLVRDEIGVRLTERGRMLGNRVFERFV